MIDDWSSFLTDPSMQIMIKELMALAFSPTWTDASNDDSENHLAELPRGKNYLYEDGRSWSHMNSEALTSCNIYMGGTPKIGKHPKMDGWQWKTLLKWIILGENPLFSETSIYILRTNFKL